MPDTMFMKERMLITGGHALQGTVHISGGKNTAVAVIPATLLCDEPCTIENLPDISDVHALVDILCSLGAKVDYEPNRFMTVDPRPAEGWQVSYRDSQRLRASYYLLGALLGRRGQAEVYQPGGCEIGSRPIDQHLKGFRMLGANVEQMGGRIKAKADVLTGTDVVFDCVSVGATINVMLAAAKAHGTTIIYNAAKEPHVVDLANFLNSMGARVKGAGTDVIRIFGRDYLHGANYTVIPDQIETGTLMIAAAATHGDVELTGCIPTHMEALSAQSKRVFTLYLLKKERRDLDTQSPGAPSSYYIGWPVIGLIARPVTGSTGGTTELPMPAKSAAADAPPDSGSPSRVFSTLPSPQPTPRLPDCE